VTTPHNQAVIGYRKTISEDAEALGAVNCISIEDGELTGYNTDWIGFRDSLIPLLTPRHWPALILGNGGASKAVQYALEQLGIAFTIVSRSKGEGVLSYEDVSAEVMELHPIIINTTTLGTLGQGKPDIHYEAINEGHLLYDLVYNPALTPFLKEGLAKRATIKNGMEMLRLQAEASWSIWQES
jgi:shikimate dehydrogenase